MLFWLLLLPWPWGALTASSLVFPQSLTLRVLQTAIFHDSSSTDIEMKALLGDLETHSMNCSTCKIRFLQPWAQQGVDPRDWERLEQETHRSLADFVRTVNGLVQETGTDYPFVTQSSIGCELHPNRTLRVFYDIGLNGEDILSFDVDTGTWVAGSENLLALRASNLVNRDKSAATKLQHSVGIICSYVIDSFAKRGKESLERQERPVAVVFAQVPSPAKTPTPFLLVCRVTGFYPRPIRVAWLQDGVEVTSGWRLNSTGILPNADLTYQLRSSLAMEPGDGHSYACQVEHISLGGQSLLIPWTHSRRWRRGLIVGVLLGVLVIAAVVVVLWWSRRHRAREDTGPGDTRVSAGSSVPGEETDPSYWVTDLGIGSGAEDPKSRSGLER